MVAPFDVRDDLPSEHEISAAVSRLRNGKATGPSEIRAEDFKHWYRIAHPSDRQLEQGVLPDTEMWDHTVRLVRRVYDTGDFPTELAWSFVVILPKPCGGVRGIGLVEILWKIIANIIDARLKSAIEFHDALHGFRSKRGTGTATMEAKLVQQLAALEQTPLYEIFLDLKKAYDCVDRERTLDILEKYGAGEKLIRLLRTYWDEQKVAARQSGYYGSVFTPTRGCTQGDVVSCTIFNVVCDAVVRYWLSVVCDDNTIPNEGVGHNVRDLIALFYADDGLIASRDSEWLQQSIDVLTDLFARVGLKTNTTKTKAMICTPGYIATQMSDQQYRRRMRGTGQTYRERQRRRVECSLCNRNLAAASLPSHMLSQHGVVHQDNQPAPPEEQARDYRVSFPPHLDSIECPVDVCRETIKGKRHNLRKHFVHRHPDDTICILEEGQHPLTKCPRCGMHVNYRALNSTHPTSQLCADGLARRRQRAAELEVRKAREHVFTACGTPLENVSSFKYLGRVLTSTDDDWPAMYANLGKARKRWGAVSRVLVRDGANPKCMAMFYKAVVQSVLLYGCETWVISDRMKKTLEGFHTRAARRITGIMPRRLGGEWVYPSTTTVLKKAGMFSMEHYIAVRRNKLVDHIATRPIGELINGIGRLSGSTTSRLFWHEQTFELDELEDGGTEAGDRGRRQT